MLDDVIAQFPAHCQPWKTYSLGNAGGFSGARFWKLETPDGWLCLRRWPAVFSSESRLAYIHRMLHRAVQAGADFVPAPIRASTGESFVRDPPGKFLWELARWMPGAALLSPGTTCDESTIQACLGEAMRRVAEFHLAVCRGESAQGLSTGLQDRYRFAERLLASECKEIATRLRSPARGSSLQQSLSTKFESILMLAMPIVRKLPDKLRTASLTNFNLQPCIRDLWHDHILFEGTRVTGIIDFGAMREETVAVDIARFLGSVSSHIPNAWQIGLAAYQQVRRLSEQESSAIALFHEANVALSGMNWLRWILIEGRSFEEPKRVEQRLDAILAALNMHVQDSSRL